MPVVGFHQARRPRQTPKERLRRDVSWPRPGGIILSLAGAALVITGAVSLGPSGAPGEPSSPLTLESTTPATANTSTAPSTASPTQAGEPPSAVSPSAGSPLEPGLLNITSPESPLVLVNKRRPLIPPDFGPRDLVTPAIASGSGEPILIRAEAAAAAERMFAAAAADGVSITVKSSYRSFAVQVQLYNSYVAQKGVAAADTTSARPGYSEHQTGLAIDIGDGHAGTACDFNSCFADTAAAKWAAAHGAEYGFVVRYQPGTESETGYLAEPWHLRYLGIAVAQDMAAQGIGSYEAYMGLPGAPGYE